MKRTIISLCDYSGRWSQPYLDDGYDVIRVDIKTGHDARLWPSDISLEPRFSSQFKDIRQYTGKVQGILAAPVCTVFSGSGAKHKRSDDDMLTGLSLVDACVRLAYATECEWWALENPVGKLIKWLGDPLLRFNPSDYAGHADDPDSEAYTKRTLLFGDFNPNLELASVDPVLGSAMWTNYGGKSERTKMMRSMTPIGFSRAFKEANP